MRAIVLFLFLSIPFWVCGQEEAQELILDAPESWAEEIIEFPIHWAPDMDLVGYEELRFHPDWKFKDKPGFWSLALVWNVNASGEFSAEKIVQNLEGYYRGLMQPNHWTTDFSEPNMVLLANPFGQRESAAFLGKIKVFDGFHTGEMMELFVKVKQRYCEEQQRVQVLFTLSPKPFDTPIWKELDAVEFKAETCD
ncbi:hypothetical protein [Gilvibacter sediminis]|uniref:hypothetical protein n=1 Tax=Gilvibacter sediminis TaxID=379071 RepID=UPI002350C29D|nr:hypothetical protein [Gilvibacter sediminis]MDC7996669.1 hypothetical protein [Gilvibacter sediminis]